MKRSALLCAAALCAHHASAAGPPKSGEDRVTVDYVVTSATPLGREHRDDPIRMRVEFSGVSHAEAGGRMFDRLGVRCAGVSELAGDSGECEAIDTHGDRVRLHYASPAPGGRLGSSRVAIVEGSGKFSGLSGDADGEVATVASTPGLPLFFASEKLIWKLAPMGAGLASAPDDK